MRSEKRSFYGCFYYESKVKNIGNELNQAKKKKKRMSGAVVACPSTKKEVIGGGVTTRK